MIRVTVTFSPGDVGVSSEGVTLSSLPRVMWRLASTSPTVASVVVSVVEVPPTLSVTFIGVVMVSARPRRPSGVDLLTEKSALAAAWMPA